MSAINVIKHRDAVHVLTDGAGFRDGAMTSAGSKVWLMPHINAAMAATGPMLQAPVLFSVMTSAARSYDHMKSLFQHRTRESIEDMLRPIQALFPDPRFVIAVAGISETQGSDAYLIHNMDSLPLPWVVQDVGPVGMVPGDAATHEAFAEAFAGLQSGDDLDPERDGLRLLEIQRRNPDFGIGGFAQLTTVTREGIGTRVIHRWGETPPARKLVA